MKLRLVLSALLSLPLLAQAAPAASPLLVIHGGAGVERKDLSPAEEKAARDALRAALLKGHAELAAGRPALAAVTAAITVLEDDPTFNAGKGAVFNAEGRHELDASVMEGHTRRAGAVAAVSTVRSPVRLARRVMEQSPHVMLIGDGAERFADDHTDLERVPNDWFDTPQRREQLGDARRRLCVFEARARGAHHVFVAWHDVRHGRVHKKGRILRTSTCEEVGLGGYERD